jgi:CRP-like cAMP-binding protein
MLVHRQQEWSAGSDSGANETSSPLIDRLNQYVSLLDDERAAVEAMCMAHRTFRAGQTLVYQGERADRVFLILSGVAVRYRLLPNGRRQIFGYLLPGDLCDTHFVIHDECDHNVGLLCDTEVAMISTQTLMHAMVTYPRLERALLMMSLMDAAMLREWLLNVAQRDAAQKLAHFFCELRTRFRAVSQRDGVQGYNIPLTQIDLADTLGLTLVHVNRIMQRFRRDGLIHWSRKHFDVLDYPRLRHLAGFDPAYLRIHRPPAEPQMNAYGNLPCA